MIFQEIHEAAPESHAQQKVTMDYWRESLPTYLPSLYCQNIKGCWYACGPTARASVADPVDVVF